MSSTALDRYQNGTQGILRFAPGEDIGQESLEKERNDLQRRKESLLRIPMKRHTSLNSLTPQDPKQAHLKRQARVQLETDGQSQSVTFAGSEKAPPSDSEGPLGAADGLEATEGWGLEDTSGDSSIECNATAVMGTTSCVDGYVAGEAVMRMRQRWVDAIVILCSRCTKLAVPKKLMLPRRLFSSLRRSSRSNG